MRINLLSENGAGRGNKSVLKDMGVDLFKELYAGNISKLLDICRESYIVLCAEFIPAGSNGNGIESNDAFLCSASRGKMTYFHLNQTNILCFCRIE